MGDAAVVDLRHPYLTRQLIAYIGSKRRLLPLVHRAVVSACGERGRGLDFLDLFAGSGAVSRLARLMGFRVLSNDWEEFARIINTAHIATDASEADRLFAREGGIEAVIAGLNALEGPPPGGEYVARFYAPRSDDVQEADYRRERLFYTRANALAIDRVRTEIERICPPSVADPAADRRRALLIAPLLYEAATHTNTSGVFKACHKGFGGHGRDALGRILAPISLERPVLLDSAPPALVFAEDANRLVRSPVLADREVEVAYLDPPYASHQYGSNYHLLTTIARWDRPPVSLALDAMGALRDKAGIRADWIATRSAYCSRISAASALADLLGALKARFIIVSYSSEGLIPLELLLQMCSTRGAVSILTNEYTKYPGGKQSSSRQIRNVEMIATIDTRRHASRASGRAARLTVERTRVALLLRRRFVRSRLEARCPRVGGARLLLELRDDGTFAIPPPLEPLSLRELTSLRSRLEECVCADAEEELAELWRAFQAGGRSGPALRRQLLGALRRLGHRRYRDRFFHWLGILRSPADPGASPWAELGSALDRMEQTVRRRLEG